MALENDQTYYRRRAEQQLAIASAALDPAIKAIHLNLASRYATLGELAARDGSDDTPHLIAPMPAATGH